MPETAPGIHGFRFHALGGPGRIRLANCDTTTAERAVTDGVRYLRESEARLSRFRPESLVSQLNREGCCPADAALLALLAVGQQAHRRTQGRLNFASAPLWQLWHDPARAAWPSCEEIDAALALCDPADVTVHDGDVRLRHGMAIDFGGIGKEWLVDQLVARLRAMGLQHFLVELAGDVAARGSQPGHRGWWVLLPDRCSAFPLQDAALATSGHHARGRWLAGRWVSHLIDAATGQPASDKNRTATALAGSCLEAGIRASDAALGARELAA